MKQNRAQPGEKPASSVVAAQTLPGLNQSVLNQIFSQGCVAAKRDGPALPVLAATRTGQLAATLNSVQSLGVLLASELSTTFTPQTVRVAGNGACPHRRVFRKRNLALSGGGWLLQSIATGLSPPLKSQLRR